MTTPQNQIVGTLQHYADVPSAHISPRNVDVWLPPDYAENPEQRYPVIYMHDGQNLFEPHLSYIGVDWGVDEAIARLMQTDGLTGAIVVGIWNTPKRLAELYPQDFFDQNWAFSWLGWRMKLGKKPAIANEYLRFMVDEVKPFVDANYRTLPERAHTFVMGSSMGGLISLYALVKYPQVFGGAGCISTHFPAGGNRMVDYYARLLPEPGAHRIYFDYGTETLDAGYEPYQQRMDAWMEKRGYRQGVDWITRKFEGDDHSERAWRRRVDIPLRFLLGQQTNGN